jgi:hypothetical protein
MNRLTYLSRRKTLALLGGGIVLAASTAAGAFVSTRTPHSALAPWDAAGRQGDPRLRALSYALLAPNPHNRQPWLAELTGEHDVIIHRDKARDLPVTDPFARQLTIGMGCFLELMVMAAAQEGLAVSLDLFPDGDDGPVAHARFAPGGAPDPLFAHVMARRSCKEPFTDEAVPASAAAALAEHARIITDATTVSALRALTWDAFEVEAYTPAAMQESVDLMRFGRSEIEANPDGIDLGGPFLESLMLAGLVNRRLQSDPASTGFKAGIDMYRTMLAATPAYAVITSAGNSRGDQIEAGRRWLRLNLATTGLGLALHPVSQALQEFAEMAEINAATHELLAADGSTVQMLGRLGYGPATPRTPRWPLETRLLNA